MLELSHLAIKFFSLILLNSLLFQAEFIAQVARLTDAEVATLPKDQQETVKLLKEHVAEIQAQFS